MSGLSNSATGMTVPHQPVPTTHQHDFHHGKSINNY